MTDSITILMIEDDADLLDGLSFSLAAEGYEVQVATTAGEGLKLFRTQKFDGILLDCNLPDGNGFDLCAQMKRACA